MALVPGHLGFSGIQVYTSPNLVTYKEPDKTWVDKVLKWNPCNHWVKPMIAVPRRDAIMDKMKNVMYVHPSMLSKLRNIT